MTEQQHIKNILAFFAIFFGESKLWQDEIMKYKPDYLIEKFNRYIRTDNYAGDWGLHSSLRRHVFNVYCEKHGIPYDEYEGIS